LRHFSTVHHLPRCAYQKNLFRGLAAAARFWKAANGVRIEPNSLYFFADAEEPLMYLLFKKRLERVRNVLTVKVHFTTPPLWAEDPTRRRLVRKTLLMMVYSAILGEPLPRMYMGLPPFESWTITYRRYQDADVVYDIANAGRIDRMALSFVNLPYPGRFVDVSLDDGHFELEEGSIIFFLNPDYLYGHFTESQFWKVQNTLLDAIGSSNGIAPLYLKLHPLMSKSCLDRVTANGWQVLRTEQPAEEVMIQAGEKIAATYSSTSTASLIAASLGIPSFLTYPLVYESDQVKAEFDRYFEAALCHLYKIRQWEDLARCGRRYGKARRDSEMERQRWLDCLGSLMAVVNSRRV
jgi:hypothetical protein